MPSFFGTNNKMANFSRRLQKLVSFEVTLKKHLFFWGEKVEIMLVQVFIRGLNSIWSNNLNFGFNAMISNAILRVIFMLGKYLAIFRNNCKFSSLSWNRSKDLSNGVSIDKSQLPLMSYLSHKIKRDFYRETIKYAIWNKRRLSF